MKEGIKLQWFGHSAFKIEYKNYSIFLDPYADNTVPGLSPMHEKANLVLCSHEHRDHNYRDGIELIDNHIENPFEISFIECPHDDEGGAKRGMNKISILKSGEITLCHLGDIGETLSEEQIKGLNIDVLMAPIGGFYTLAPEKINNLVAKINPNIFIPMHYRNEEFGYDVIGTLDDYLKYCKNIKYYDTNTLIINNNTESHTAILKYIK
ncbi:MBL fold metallo-hydrolase [Fusobacterium sp. PH5-44]|uniref:MBL fold metallo-hydrolase n=1 Tax=unclassified Fusobacterium TaxID=2648384 RepID=UPI003D230543